MVGRGVLFRAGNLRAGMHRGPAVSGGASLFFGYSRDA